MRRRRTLALTGGLLAAALAGCVSEDGDQLRDDDGDADSLGCETGDTDVDDAAVGTLVEATNGFGFDLYRELLEDDGNLFVSPLSIALALAMTYGGARSRTREQMREVLRYELDDEVVHAALGELQATLDDRGSDSDGENSESDEDGDEETQPFELAIANSVWGQEGFPFEESYLETVDDHYCGGLREVDYESDPEGVREEINEWVADMTEDRIEELLPAGAVDTYTRLVLVNAIYFVANWKHPFPESLTEEASFTALDGTEHDVEMMEQDRPFPHAAVDGAEAVELPYVGGDVSMLVVLPPDGEFESYEAAFDEETLSELVAGLESRRLIVNVPQFEIETNVQLADSLNALGMTDAFDAGSADFEALADTEESLFLDEVFHDTFVAVDEEGTEAAAATGAVSAVESAPPTLRFDRPFLFAIRDRPTGTVLFLGRATDPSGWN